MYTQYGRLVIFLNGIEEAAGLLFKDKDRVEEGYKNVLRGRSEKRRLN